MPDERYLKRQDLDFCLAHVIEECGELLAAAGKTQRWGWDSADPTIPAALRESNASWLRREMADVQGAIARLGACMDAPKAGAAAEGPADPIEAIVTEALNKTGYAYLVNADGLDFTVPELGVAIACKQFYTPRVAAQMQRVDNLIVIQGIGAAKAFRALIGRQ